MDQSFLTFLNVVFFLDLRNAGIPTEIENGITNAVYHSLKNLSDREAQVIASRYGFYGESASLREVGAHLGISGARVRDIEVHAIQKLRRNSAGHPIRAYLFETELLDTSHGILDPRHAIKLKEKARLGERLSDNELARVPLDEIDLGQRCKNALRNQNVQSLLDIKNLTEWEFLRIPNIGVESFKEVQGILAEFGHSLQP